MNTFNTHPTIIEQLRTLDHKDRLQDAEHHRMISGLPLKASKPNLLVTNMGRLLVSVGTYLSEAHDDAEVTTAPVTLKGRRV